ncbi:hypothetical protein ACWGJ2_36705 [Streptomyces sp. NPDC054796]
MWKATWPKVVEPVEGGTDKITEYVYYEGHGSADHWYAKTLGR